MPSRLIELFNDSDLAGLATKNKALKRAVIHYLGEKDQATVAELGKELNISVPKATGVVTALVNDSLLCGEGKNTSTGGRRASAYSLNADAAYFMGVDVLKDSINVGLINFKSKPVEIKSDIPFNLKNDTKSFTELISVVQKFIKGCNLPKSKILCIGLNLSGRVNNETGYSYSYFNFSSEPLTETLEKVIGIPITIDNDSRSMALGEYFMGTDRKEKNVLFINMDYGLGMGIITDGKIFYGKSGFSGEIGHIPFFENEIICHCGKKGCLETEASGYALLRKFKEKLLGGSKSQLSKKYKKAEDILLHDLVNAALNEDVLAIDMLGEIGEKIGKGVAAFVNIFNPELIILGGELSQTGDYIRLPLMASLNKYSISLVNQDAKLKMSELGKDAGVLGACLIARNKVVRG